MLLEDVIREQIDVILFLEYNGKNINLAKFQQTGFTPVVVHPRPYTHGLLLLAKQELQITGAVYAAPVTGLCRLPFVAARLHHQGCTYAIIGVHIPTPTRRCGDTRRSNIVYLASIIDNGHLSKNIEPAQAGDAVILLGDFNTISFEAVLDPLFASGVEDVYSRHHWLPGPTWSQPTWFPALFRLDYIFVSQEIATAGSWTVPIKGSDHRGVVADIILK